MSADPGLLAVERVRSLLPYVPGKPIKELERELGVENAIKLASNENPRGPSPAARAAMLQALDDVWLYPDGSCHELRSALASHLGVRFEQLTVGNGSNDLLVLLAEAYLTPDTSVVCSQYGFIIYSMVAHACGARLIEVPALTRGTMPLGADLPAMRRAVRDDTRLVFLANPNNPTGTWAASGELEAFIADLPSSTLVVLDEAYFEYGRLLGTSDGVQWLARYPNLVVLRTFSKAYGMAGVRVGYAVSHPRVAEMLNRVRPAFNVNSVAQAGALAALADQSYMVAGCEDTMRELERVQAGLRRLGLVSVPSAGNFVLVRFANAARTYDRLLRRGLITRPVANYGLPDYLRISIGLRDQNDALLAALAEELRS